jgi:hypothetical protein
VVDQPGERGEEPVGPVALGGDLPLRREAPLLVDDRGGELRSADVDGQDLIHAPSMARGPRFPSRR